MKIFRTLRNWFRKARERNNNIAQDQQDQQSDLPNEISNTTQNQQQQSDLPQEISDTTHQQQQQKQQPKLVIDLTEPSIDPRHIIDLTQDESDDDVRNIRTDLTLRRRTQEKAIHKHRPTQTATNIANIIKEKCRECLVVFNQPGRVLTQRQRGSLCLGCDRMFSVIRYGRREEEDMRLWLRTGELPMEVWVNDIDNSTEEVRIKNRASFMRSRLETRPYLSWPTKHTFSKDLPSKEELFKLYIDCGCKCAITGWICHIPRYGGPRYWSVSIDHIVPVSTAPVGMNPWSIKNIQILSHIINIVKGNNTDHEVRQWYQDWMNAHL